MDDENVALYLDFENLAISAEEVYPSKERPLLIGPIVDFATTKGNVCIKKAYADWEKPFFSQYQKRLMEHGFELIHLPATTSQGKNGSDVKLAIDVMENMELFKTINTLIIGSGDTDFIPLIQRIRARGKKVIVFGFDHTVGDLIKINSTEFKSLEELIGKPDEDSVSLDLSKEIEVSYGRDLLIRYATNKTDEGAVPLAKLKQDFLRLDPSFSEKKLGHSTFKDFIESLKGDVIEKIEFVREKNHHLVYFTNVELKIKEQKNQKEEAQHFLNKSLKYLKRSSKRSKLFKILFDGFVKNQKMTLHEVVDYLFDNTESITKITVRKFINTLFTGNAFIPYEKNIGGSLLSRLFKLKGTINNPEILEQIYVNRVIEIISNRYPDINDKEINELI